MYIYIFVDVVHTKCTSGFLSSLSSQNYTYIPERMDNFSFIGFYIFPELKFHCETHIESIYGYFIMDPDATTFYFQIWREEGDLIVRVDQIELDFDIHCQDNIDGLCYINHTLSRKLEVIDGDFIGFYMGNNSLAEPLFSPSTSNIQLFLIQSFVNEKEILVRSSIFISYHPEVLGMFLFNVIFVHTCVATI